MCNKVIVSGSPVCYNEKREMIVRSCKNEKMDWMDTGGSFFVDELRPFFCFCRGRDRNQIGSPCGYRRLLSGRTTCGGRRLAGSSQLNLYCHPRSSGGDGNKVQRIVQLFLHAGQRPAVQVQLCIRCGQYHAGGGAPFGRGLFTGERHPISGNRNQPLCFRGKICALLPEEREAYHYF